MGKSKIGTFGKVLIKFTSSQVIYNGLKMIAGFLVVRLIAPEIYGAFSGVGIFLGYVMLGHFGILSGLRRELPFQYGNKNEKLVDGLASLGFFVSLVVGSLSSLVFFTFLIYQLISGTFIDVAIYSSFTIVSFFHLLNKGYLPSLFRTTNEFDKLSKINIVLALVNILSVALVWQYALLGLCFRAVLLSIVEFGLLYFNRPISVGPKWNYQHAKLLITTGIPIFAVGQVRPLWTTVMNSLIFTLGGPLQFGYYALVNIINGALGIIPNSIGQVIYPKMSIHYGQGKDVLTILKGTLKPMIFQFIVILFVAITTCLILPVLIPLLLPKYVNGIEAAQWITFLPVVASLGLVNNIYNVIKRQKWYFISLIIGAFIGAGYSLTMVQMIGFDIIYFAQGMILGTFIQLVLSLLFLMKLLNHED